ncbi:hypothetical protein [Nocardia sp. NPDC051463]|uniref:hypothetical protein n=1 Tax=Nocardia sp. NPDC051463 TaxID=3154845 RepID=UPI00344D81E5
MAGLPQLYSRRPESAPGEVSESGSSSSAGDSAGPVGGSTAALPIGAEWTVWVRVGGPAAVVLPVVLHFPVSPVRAAATAATGVQLAPTDTVLPSADASRTAASS